MTVNQGEDRTFNVQRALASWQARYPWRLERMAVLERIRIDCNQKGHVWSAENVRKMLRQLEKTA